MDISLSASEFVQTYRPLVNPVRAQAGFPHRHGFRHTGVRPEQYDLHQLWSLVKDQAGIYIVNGIEDAATEILITEIPW
jgi:hypothetical protein